ncbi:MAG TPA: flagellar basal body rod protein FlgB [Xanthobacteraceae bacterium]|jgi:flagellar basal-body rod protein FlgB
MAIADIPILTMLRTRMQWQQQRQQVLAQNVANADTPNYRPMELTEPKFQAADTAFGPLQLARDDPGQLPGLVDAGTFPGNRQQFEVRPAGNAVSLEDEMMKVAANQMDYTTATQLYTHSLTLLKTAADKS